MYISCVCVCVCVCVCAHASLHLPGVSLCGEYAEHDGLRSHPPQGQLGRTVETIAVVVVHCPCQTKISQLNIKTFSHCKKTQMRHHKGQYIDVLYIRTYIRIYEQSCKCMLCMPTSMYECRVCMCQCRLLYLERQWWGASINAAVQSQV